MKTSNQTVPGQLSRPLELFQAPGRSCSLKSSCPPKGRAKESLVASSLQEGMGLGSVRVQWGHRTQAAKDLGKLVLLRFPITGLGE